VATLRPLVISNPHEWRLNIFPIFKILICVFRHYGWRKRHPENEIFGRNIDILQLFQIRDFASIERFPSDLALSFARPMQRTTISLFSKTA